MVMQRISPGVYRDPKTGKTSRPQGGVMPPVAKPIRPRPQLAAQAMNQAQGNLAGSRSEGFMDQQGNMPNDAGYDQQPIATPMNPGANQAPYGPARGTFNPFDRQQKLQQLGMGESYAPQQGNLQMGNLQSMGNQQGGGNLGQPRYQRWPMGGSYGPQGGQQGGGTLQY